MTNSVAEKGVALARRARDLVLGGATLGVFFVADPKFAVLRALRSALTAHRERSRRERRSDRQNG